jgi:hypothetical protein
LPLIVAIREEINDLVSQPRLPQDMWHGAINDCMTTPTPFIGKWPRIANTGHHQTMFDLPYMRLVAR